MLLSMEVDEKKLNKIRKKKTKHAKRMKLLDQLLLDVSLIDQSTLLVSLFEDTSLDSRFRIAVLYKMKGVIDHHVVRCLRQRVHDKSETRYVRINALDALMWMDESLFHVDLRSLLCDLSEASWMRAEAAEKIGATSNELAFRSVLLDILTRPKVQKDVAFWCVYACSGLPDDPEVVSVLEHYLNDFRKVDTGISVAKGPATIAEEAQWALQCIKGIYTDPTWMVSD